MKTFERGDTIQITWTESTVSAVDDSAFQIISGSESVVNTGTLSSSGNGHFYADFTVPSSYSKGFYVAKTIVTVGGLPYVRSEKFKVNVVEVD